MKLKLDKRLLFRRIFPLASVLIGITILASCAPTSTARGWSGGTIANGNIYIGSMSGKLLALRASDGSQLWNAPLVTQAPSTGFGCSPGTVAVPIYGSPAVGGDLVYVGGYDGIMSAYSANTGASRWVYPRQGALGGPIIGGATVADGNIYFAASVVKNNVAVGTVYALDASTGDKKWEAPLSGKIWSTPAVSGDTLFVSSFDHKLYALNTADGSLKWQEPFTANGAIEATPLVNGDTVYVGSFDRHLYALDTASGKELWRFPADDNSQDRPANWFWAQPVISGNNIYTPNLDGKVYVINAQNGQMITRLDVGQPVSSNPVIAGGLIIAAGENGIIYAFDINTQQQKWANDEIKTSGQKIYASLATDQQVIYVHTSRGELYAFNAQSGAKLWSLPLKSL